MTAAPAPPATAVPPPTNVCHDALSGFQSVQPRSRIGLSRRSSNDHECAECKYDRSFSMKSSQFFAPDEAVRRVSHNFLGEDRRASNCAPAERLDSLQLHDFWSFRSRLRINHAPHGVGVSGNVLLGLIKNCHTSPSDDMREVRSPSCPLRTTSKPLSGI
jgi:hypothetical protein